MIYKENLIPAKIVGSYKNLILDVELEDGDLVHAFCPETDFKQQLYPIGATALLSKSADGRRKVPYVCQMTDSGSGLIFVNYKYKNQLFIEAFSKGVLDADFGAYSSMREIKNEDMQQIANFELQAKDGRKAYVYVVNIFNKVNDDVVFPSTINFFELEMFNQLRQMREEGAETYVFLIVPREDCSAARFVWSQDPIAAAKIFDEVKSGLKFCCYRCKVTQKSVAIDKKLEIVY